MSSSALGPLTAPLAQKGSAAGGSSRRALACSSRRLPRPAHGPQTHTVRRQAVRCGACSPEPAMRSRRWRSGSVGPPDPGRGCPKLVKPILLMDIGVCMLQHPSGRASRVESMVAERVVLSPWVPLGEVLGYLVGYRSSRAGAWGTQGLGSRTRRTVKIWDLVLGDVPLELGPLDGT